MKLMAIYNNLHSDSHWRKTHCCCIDHHKPHVLLHHQLFLFQFVFFYNPPASQNTSLTEVAVFVGRHKNSIYLELRHTNKSSLKGKKDVQAKLRLHYQYMILESNIIMIIFLIIITSSMHISFRYYECIQILYFPEVHQFHCTYL